MNALVVSTIPNFALSVAVSLSLAGVRPHVLGDVRWPAVRLSRHCARYRHLSRRDLEEGSPAALETIERECAIHGIDVVIPSDMRTTRMLARSRDRITAASLFPLADIGVIDALHDKWRFARFLEEHSLPRPRTQLLESSGDLRKLDLPYPVIVKPVEGECGVGVSRLETPEALSELVLLRERDGILPIVVQEWLPGADIDLSLLADRGEMVAWTVQRRPGDEPGCVEFVRDPGVVELGRRIVAASAFHGIAHIDMRIDSRSGQTNVIELNPRFWGSLFFSVWGGVNFPALGAGMARGEDPRPRFTPIEGRCTNPGVSPRRLFRALSRGRFVPDDLPPASRNAWRTNHLDPLPLVWDELVSVWSRRSRRPL